MKNTAVLGILAALVLGAGCMMGPKYKRPTVDVPQEYRAPAPQQAGQASSLSNEGWWQVYQDPVLAQVIHTAIADNYDVRIAAARVLEAQAQSGSPARPKVLIRWAGAHCLVVAGKWVMPTETGHPCRVGVYGQPEELLI